MEPSPPAAATPCLLLPMLSSLQATLSPTLIKRLPAPARMRRSRESLTSESHVSLVAWHQRTPRLSTLLKTRGDSDEKCSPSSASPTPVPGAIAPSKEKLGSKARDARLCPLRVSVPQASTYPAALHHSPGHILKKISGTQTATCFFVPLTKNLPGLFKCNVVSNHF